MPNVIIPRLLPEVPVVAPPPEVAAPALPQPLPQPPPMVSPPAVATTSKPASESSRRALNKLLEQFLVHLQKKDSNQVPRPLRSNTKGDTFSGGSSLHHSARVTRRT
jgi:hypothetical protein